MDVLFDNSIWMLFNIWLAVLGVVYGWLFLFTKNPLLKIFSFVLWLLFIPNTIYLLTDLTHFFEQIQNVSGIPQFILILQYIIITIIGVVTFILALYPFEKVITSKKVIGKKHDVFFIVAINFLISFGVILGRIQRTNSWEAFTNTQKTLHDMLQVLRSTELMVFVFIFGIFCNILYFSFRGKFLRYWFLKRI